MTDITIPPEALEAAAKELADTNGWRNEQGIAVCRPVAEAVLRAGIAAWPGMIGHGDIVPGENGPPLHIRNAIILPTENANAEA